MAQENAEILVEENIRTQGKGSANLKRRIRDALTSDVPWSDLLQEYASAAMTIGYDYSVPCEETLQQGFFAPRRGVPGIGSVVAFIDVSGSVSDATVGKFLRECGGILADCNPESLSIVAADADVTNWETYSFGDDPTSFEPRGGGGTDFVRPLQWLEDRVASGEIEPPALILYFTDGYGTFPQENPFPDTPFLWLSYGRQAQDYPWGDVLWVNEY